MKAKKFATQVDEGTLKLLKSFAAKSDKSISKIVTEALDEYLKKYQVRSVFFKAMNEVLDENDELLRRLAK